MNMKALKEAIAGIQRRIDALERKSSSSPKSATTALRLDSFAERERMRKHRQSKSALEKTFGMIDEKRASKWEGLIQQMRKAWK